MLKVITVTNNLEATQSLINSLDKFGWDYHVIGCEWKGFGTKLIEVFRYLKANPEVTEFIFCDAHDVICLAGESEFRRKIRGYKNKILMSAERGLWPPILHPFRKLYNRFPHRFDYINSGLYYAESKDFISIVEQYPPFNEIDDQYWISILWLLYDDNSEVENPIAMDNNQRVFNSHSFIDDGEYTYENNRVQILGNEPTFIHFNGRTVDEKFNQLIKI